MHSTVLKMAFTRCCGGKGPGVPVPGVAGGEHSPGRRWGARVELERGVLSPWPSTEPAQS